MLEQYTPSQFKNASQFVTRHHTLEDIYYKWNAEQHERGGNSAKMETVIRWLSQGPKTKNSRFEPFIIDWFNEDKATLNLPYNTHENSLMLRALCVSVGHGNILNEYNSWADANNYNNISIGALRHYCCGKKGYINGPPSNTVKFMAARLLGEVEQS